MTHAIPHRLGATPLGGGRCRFEVWSPRTANVAVHLVDDDRVVAMAPIDDDHHYAVEVDAVPDGARYRYRLGDRGEWPDPASRAQPDGVHGPSAAVDLAFTWTDQRWQGASLDALVLYELHVGTFTAEGTFDAVIPHLARLRALGVTAIELMPVAQCPGARNWGYDGVYPYAVQPAYGGPLGLKRLVDAAHREGLGVHLDVVYNHLGPEGNYLGQYGPYFTDVYKTPWGSALNFDGPHSDAVRRYFIENALQWVEDFHLDGLRLDAVHAIVDRSSYPFLEELSDRVHARAEALGREVLVVAESDANDPRLVQRKALGGMGLDGVWSDDFHHAVHALLTGERDGYYMDFGRASDLAEAWRHGAAYRGRRSSFRQRRHGRDAPEVEGPRHVVCSQNHDQVGNRARGERLIALTDLARAKLAAALVILSPNTPLLFMGEEHGETAPFLYFIDHGDAGLIEAIRRGRTEEFKDFAWTGELPDPAAVETMRRCVVDHDAREREPGRALYALYGELLKARARLRPREGERDG
ncbi:MAG: malto-oligosyltrehalose trehalohydrolase [Polyangiales bacterium]